MVNASSQKYSVVLRVRNEERWVGYAIQSIVDHIGESCEIIIVNNGTADDSLRIVNLFEYLDVKKVDIPSSDYTPGKALNLVLSLFNGSILFLLLNWLVGNVPSSHK